MMVFSNLTRKDGIALGRDITNLLRTEIKHSFCLLLYCPLSQYLYIEERVPDQRFHNGEFCEIPIFNSKKIAPCRVILDLRRPLYHFISMCTANLNRYYSSRCRCRELYDFSHLGVSPCWLCVGVRREQVTLKYIHWHSKATRETYRRSAQRWSFLRWRWTFLLDWMLVLVLEVCKRLWQCTC